MEGILPDEHKDAAIELMVYWSNCFGNETRIDYGTGHETNFVVILFCMYKYGLDHRSIDLAG